MVSLLKTQEGKIVSVLSRESKSCVCDMTADSQWGETTILFIFKNIYPIILEKNCEKELVYQQILSFNCICFTKQKESNCRPWKLMIGENMTKRVVKSTNPCHQTFDGKKSISKNVAKMFLINAGFFMFLQSRFLASGY